MRRTERYKNILDWFELNMPVAESELHYNTPFELLVAVILSAQCTDKRVNQYTPALFQRFPTPEKMSCSSEDEIFEYIKSISFPNNKAKNLYKMSNQLVTDFSSVIPSDIKELESLAGVGRKTANVIASIIYNKPTMAVDTHVFRVSRRIGLTVNAKNPLQAEEQLVSFIPKRLIPIAHHWLILHGRYVCTARKPKCEECGIAEWCKRDI